MSDIAYEPDVAGNGEMAGSGDEVFVLPASFAQQRLWFFDRLQPGGSTYNMPLVVRVAGALDVDALRRALAEVVRRHESLRTVFSVVDHQPVQVILPEGRGALAVEDLSGVPAATREDAMRARVNDLTALPFDLERGPLFVPTLLRLDADDHVLVLAMHHIISDGWSLSVLLGEVSTLYDAFRQGLPSPLPELPLQYADYASWQREYLSGEMLETQLRWWKEHFAGAPPVLELPTDRPRPAVQTYRGASHEGYLMADLSRGVQELARREGATPFMVMLAVFSLLLSRYAREEQVVVGTPIAGRNQPETEGMIGFFVNTLAIHADLSGDPSFRALLGRVRDATLGAYAHQEFPFERLVDELKLERSLSHSPLFQVMFNMLNTPSLSEGGELAGTTFLPVDFDTTSEKYDLTVTAQETPHGIYVSFSYNPDLFDAATAGRMMDHFGGVLSSVLAEPDVPVSRLAMMEPRERERVTTEWNRTAAPFPAERCVHHLFEEQAARTPDAVAARFGGVSTTYAELDARANRVARRLRALGVGPEVRVAFSLERGPHVVAAVLGILKAGGAYVPVDPAYPAERRRYMLEDSRARVVLTQPHLAADLPATGAEVVLLDPATGGLAGGGADEAAEEGGDLPVPVDPLNLAYVIYTSGSTGLPKGVAVPHRGVVNLALAGVQVYGLSEETRFLQFASFSFDATVFEWAATFAAGGTLVMGTREEMIPGPALVALMESEGVNMAVLPHSVLAVLPSDGLPAFTTVATGGEACSAEVAARWSRGRRFFNAYGPTEITVASSIGPFGGDGERRPPIGGPLPNTRSYVLDAALRPVPVGVPGELCVGGTGVTRGYLERPGLTAGRYVPDPFAEEPGARMYRTGDLVRWLPDGTLDYLRRLDDQVKVRGFRVELGEIDAVLRAHPHVRDAAVVVREDRPGDKRIAAYFVGEEDGSPTPAELRVHVAERLPEHMVPSFFVPLEVLPLTPNGKVDRKALPEPEGGATAAHVFVPAADETEETLVRIWKEVLGTERVGANDNFFELGGHSLLLAQVQTRIKEEMGRDVAMVDLFRYPTIRTLSQSLTAGEDAGAALVEKAQEKADARRAARSNRRDRRGR